VDNNSKDGSQETLLKRFPNVRWIQMGYNSGFARANNEGIRQSKGIIKLLLNADTIIINNAIENCLLEFSLSSYMACGVQLLYADGSPQIAGNYIMTGGLNYLLPLPFLGDFLKWIGNRLSVKRPNLPNTNEIAEVDWINGAFLMVKESAIREVGLLDEDFFLYAEEAEWCSRIQRTGPLCIYGQYKVIHLQGETANTIFGSAGKGYYNLYDRKGLQIIVSNFVRIRKQFGIFWFLIQLFFYVMTVPLFFVGVFIQKVFGKKGFSYAQCIAFSKNLAKLLLLSPTILRNRPYFYNVL
jgi:GT2 family glycosyltransferase